MYCENDTDKRLISCVFQNMADDAICILESGSYHKRLLDDIGLTNSRFPLYWLVKCNKMILDCDDWTEEFRREVILPARNDCNALLAFFKHNGLDYPGDVDYTLFPKERGHFKDWDFEDLFDASIDELCAMGYDKDECLLCYAVLRGDIREIERQVEMRTNPDVWISGSEDPKYACAVDGSSYNALVACSSFYGDCLSIYDLCSYLRRGRDKVCEDITYRMLAELIEASFYRKVELMLTPLQRQVVK